MNKKVIEYFDPIANQWLEGYFIGYTSRNHTVVELVGGGVIVLPDGTARFRDVGVTE